jgi:AcrR family transcriptional regulator
METMQEVASRRERMRAATENEIKELAWAQIADVGPGGLSLREIARQMGMTSSALYRYFASRDDLLEELAADSFAALADALEAAESESVAQGLPTAQRWLNVAAAHRRWALEHRSEYTLVFNTPAMKTPALRDLDCPVPRKMEEMKRGVDVLFRVLLDAVSSGEFNPSNVSGSVPTGLRAKVDQWRLGDPTCPVPPKGLPASAVAACLVAWAQLHGAITLELSGRLPPDLCPADELFEYQMHHLLVSTLGWDGERRKRGSKQT